MGYDKELVESLPQGDGDYYTEDKFTRHQGVDFSHGETDGDKKYTGCFNSRMLCKNGCRW